MRHFLLILALILLSQSSYAQDPVYDFLVWSDEFNGVGSIDGTKWHHQTQLPNGDSWYNSEIQHYTDNQENSFMENGSLFLTAKRQNFTDQGVTKQFTSARLNSKFAFTYGRVEIRAILPEGIGTWPAMWSLGKNIIEPGGYWSSTHGTTSWPACGEIDLMEHWGNNQDYVASATHTPSSYGNTVNVDGRVVPNVSNTFHIFEMEWSPDKIVFKINGFVHYIYEPSVQNADTWPFYEEQYLLLNVAILPNIDPSFIEDAMEIDYVRVYQETVLGNESAMLQNQITVFPNPTAHVLNITIPSSAITSKLRLYNVLGQEVIQSQLLRTENQLDVSGLAQGTYFLELETPLGVYKEMLVK